MFQQPSHRRSSLADFLFLALGPMLVYVCSRPPNISKALRSQLGRVLGKCYCLSMHQQVCFSGVAHAAYVQTLLLAVRQRTHVCNTMPLAWLACTTVAPSHGQTAITWSIMAGALLHSLVTAALSEENATDYYLARCTGVSIYYCCCSSLVQAAKACMHIALLIQKV